jgi:hypothetical protein
MSAARLKKKDEGQGISYYTNQEIHQQRTLRTEIKKLPLRGKH